MGTMSLWRRVLFRLGLLNDPGPRTYELNEDLAVTLTRLARHEGRPEDELLADLVTAGLTRYYSQDELWRQWQSLSPREQDVAALACLGYTNRQIAARLNISSETVKSRLHNALQKLNLHKRTELRLLLAEWDFSRWES